MKRPDSQLKTDLAALDELIKSRGWQIILDGISREYRQLTRNMAGNPKATDRELQYYLGALFAMDRFIELPALIQQVITNDLVLKSATADASKEKTK